MYRAKVRFRDLQDGHLYEQGDTFPHDGREVPAKRINALATSENASNRPLIEEIVEIVKEAPETVEPEPAHKPRKARKKA